jgi:hypothetical protein
MRIVACLPVLFSLLLANCALFSPAVIQTEPTLRKPAKISLLSEIKNISPKDTDGVPVASQIKLIFRSESLLVRTISKTVFILMDSSSSRKVSCDTAYCKNGICFVPKDKLSPDTRYYCTIANLVYINPANGDSIRLGGSCNFSFKTGIFPNL